MLFSEPKIPQCDRSALRGNDTAEFQCSSASRKFLNFATALVTQIWNTQFQCSSASRKFLNQRGRSRRSARGADRFSALQRAENSSIGGAHRCAHRDGGVSVLFSEPKIPQFKIDDVELSRPSGFSALQRAENSSIVRDVGMGRGVADSFSALQRAENSSIERHCVGKGLRFSFSALQRAENSSNVAEARNEPRG